MFDDLCKAVNKHLHDWRGPCTRAPMLTTSIPEFFVSMGCGVETPMLRGRSMFVESLQKYAGLTLEIS